MMAAVMEPDSKPETPKPDAKQPPEDSRKLLANLTFWADPLSKAVAGVVIAVYACGFLVVSLYHSRYGFIGANPFRPRILAAGAWFFFLSAIPVSLAFYYRGLSWARLFEHFLWFCIFFVGLSFPFAYVLFNLSPLPASVSPSKFSWIGLLALFVALCLIAVASYFSKRRRIITGTLSVLFTIGFLAFALREFVVQHSFRQEALAVWFFGVFLLSFVHAKTRTKQALAEMWSRPMGTFFAALLLFAQYYYPYLKSSWGGGSPITVTLYFTKDAALSPNKVVTAQLIEESDEGFYIVGQSESRAIFVPRGAIALAYFSDKPTDSPLLQNIK